MQIKCISNEIELSIISTPISKLEGSFTLQQGSMVKKLHTRSDRLAISNDVV